MMMETTKEDTFLAQYDTKDAILYALAVGYGSDSSEDELRYVFEHHENFCVVPTFVLTLLFRSDRCSAGLPPFPPPFMEHMGLIPTCCLLDSDVRIDEYPILHVSQSITWNRKLPAPCDADRVEVTLSGRTVAVIPKTVGTFVRQRLSVHSNDESLLCTLETTSLVLGLDPQAVQPFGEPSSGNSLSRGRILMNVEYQVQANAALFYRVASGDSNRIHVDQSPIGDRPILHGLCTLGIVARYLRRVCPEQIKSLQCRFTKPVFVGDRLRIQVWAAPLASTSTVSFLVDNVTQGNIALDGGIATFDSKSRL